MSDYIHMRHGSPEQRDELMELLNSSFSFERGENGFEGLLPKLYNEEYSPAENNIILDVNKEMRAAVGLYYNTLTVCGTELKIGGIGNVGVLHEHRNKGYMGFCMAFALDEMKQNMTDFSHLGGRRQRYENFSYEPGGIQYRLIFNTDNLRKKLGESYTDGCQVRELTRGDCALDEILKVHESNPRYRASRPWEKLFDILTAWRNKAYAVFEKGEFLGWFVTNSKKTKVEELGCPEGKSYTKLAACALKLSEERSIEIYLPAFDEEKFRELALCCEDVAIGDCNCCFTVFSYERVIKAFLELKSTYERLADGECVMFIEGAKLPENIKITVKDNKVTVCETEEKADILLSHNEAMRLIGSIYSEKRNQLKPECASWFPLPFYIFEQDNV